MRLPPPKNTEEVKIESILQSLPTEETASKVIRLTFTLSSFSPNEVYLGQYPDPLFQEEAVLEMMEEYRQDLVRISEEKKETNN
ncbi:polyunsaturated fatty acid 5-lipoxygenase-like isoform X2 [Clavelina lepadiformis]